MVYQFPVEELEFIHRLRLVGYLDMVLTLDHLQVPLEQNP